MERELQLLQDKNERLEREVADLINQIRLLEEENAKLKEENRQFKKDDAELCEMLEKTLQEADKLGAKIDETQKLFEVPPKSQ